MVFNLNDSNKKKYFNNLRTRVGNFDNTFNHTYSEFNNDFLRLSNSFQENFNIQEIGIFAEDQDKLYKIISKKNEVVFSDTKEEINREQNNLIHKNLEFFLNSKDSDGFVYLFSKINLLSYLSNKFEIHPYVELKAYTFGELDILNHNISTQFSNKYNLRDEVLKDFEFYKKEMEVLNLEVFPTFHIFAKF